MKIFTYHSQKLRFLLLTLFGGIFLGQSLFFISYFLLIGLLFLVLSFSLKNYWILILSFFCLGAFYGQYRNSTDLQNDQIINFYTQSVEIIGVVDNFPDIRKNNNRVFIRVIQINKPTKNTTNYSISNDIGRLLLIYPSQTPLDYGDIIKFEGNIKKPKNFDNFDYKKYLKRFGIQSIVKNPKKIEIINSEVGGNIFILYAKKLRNYLAKNLENALPIPHNQIAMGILLGVKKELPKNVSQNFKNAGLQHILVVSGFNVTILMVSIALLLQKFGQRVVFIGSIVCLLFFTMMVGADPPVLRATIFGGIVGWAIVSGRFSDSRNLLFLTAVILAIYSPQMIQSDVGFFLSFAATLGIILGLPLGQWFFDFLTNKFEFRSIISVIVFAQLSVFPVLSLYFGTFPVIGFFANILVEPLIPLGMFFSFLVSIAPSTLGLLNQIISIPAFLILEIIILLANFFGKFEPIIITKNISIISFIFVGIFFFWGSFSSYYQQRFLEREK